MSTPPRPPRALFTGLIDDAAVFPPGNAPLPDAITRREHRRNASYADLIGPLLLPPQQVTEAVAGTSPLTVAVIGRPDADLGPVLTAARLLADAKGHSLAGIELAYRPGWRDALELGVPIAVEITPDQGGLESLADLAGNEQVRAKLRTGSTETINVPTASQVGAFLLATTEHGIAFKLTGGMHQAIAHTASTAGGQESQHGFLNVLLATRLAQTGATAADVNSVLEQRDPAAIVDEIRALDGDAVAAVRNQFHSYGCCDVLDPVRDLAHLKLIEEQEV
ncbi:hypothetical protein [Luteipulveratus mongoliensis]|uniref:Transaldolase n=1 Tax=Luteipulveratus mongoliensis TaxID=571913 RepID=A0A0K1JIB7_9MICO|nr:hypothetical protein [Luteipulveratus mongoliensis]AKU16325.1 hypothetical protein VV02_11390 [Luteipulveratus mongoliensis]